MTNTSSPVSYFGTPVQNEVLTALAPADVPANLVGYQWQASSDGLNWVSIASATANTFTLTQAQVGSAIRVLVTTSAASDSVVQNVNDLPVGSIDITGASTGGAAEGDTLALTAAKLSDLDGLGNFSYQWQVLAAGATDWADISGATAAQLTLAQAQVGASIRAKVSYTDGGGTAEAVFSAATSAVANVNNAPTGGVSIALQSDASNAAPAMVSASSTLVANNSLADIDGMGAVQYQWQQQAKDANGATVWVNIDQATGATLARPDLAGKTVRVVAAYTDAFGVQETANSATVKLLNDLPDGAVTISGTFAQGEVLTASHTLQDPNGLGQVHYQWFADGAAISGASAQAFTLTQTQVGKAIAVVASYTDLAGTSEAVSSASSAKVANVNDAPSGTVAITGASAGGAAEGNTLSASGAQINDLDGLGNFSYQWQVLATGATDWTDISGANAAQLTLAQAQVGASIRAKVSYTDGGGTAETVYSAATSAVANVNNASTGSVGIALQSDTSSAAPAMVSASSTLVASNSLADQDGMGTVHYQWQQQAQDANGATVWIDISQANTETLAVSNLAGKTVRVAATHTDAFGALESRVSASTLVNDLPIGAVTLSGSFTQGQTLTASHTLQDTNGLGQVHYQWFADGVAISGAVMADDLTSTLPWTRLVGGENTDVGCCVSVGADGSVYIAGSTYGSIDGQANNGGADGFVTKYTADGTKAWTRLAGGAGSDVGYSVATGTDGSVYIAGYTYGSIDGQANNGGADGFVTKYTADGTKAWTRLVGDADTDVGFSVATGTDGSVYIAGYTTSGSIDGQASNGGTDGFVTKFAADGTKAWTRLVGGADSDVGYSVATGADGSVYIGGYTHGSSIDGLASNGGSADGFVTKYTADGTEAWTRLAGGAGDDYGVSVATGTDGSVYIAGHTTSGSIDGQTNNGAWDGFVTKYTADGTQAWTRLAGEAGNDVGYSVATGADGSVYIGGYTDSGSIDSQSSNGGLDGFVTKYTADGTKAWTRLAGGAGDDIGMSVATGADGSVFTAGHTSGGSIDGQTSNGGVDSFVTKFSSQSAQPAGASTFTLTQAQVGKVISVKVSYTDLAGTSETVSSASSALVANVNDAPALTGQTTNFLAGTEDRQYVLTPAQLLAGYSDLDGDTLRVSDLAASHGSITVNIDGSYTFTPDANFNGTVTLSYSVLDGQGGSTPTQQTLTLNAVNDAPALTGAPAVLASGTEDTAFTISAADLLKGYSDVEGDSLSVSDLRADQASVQDNGDGTYTVTPAPNYNGVLNLSYKVIDGSGGQTSSVSTVILASVNDAPTGAVSITGASAGGVAEGDQLTVSGAQIGDSDGLGNFSYQWQVLATGATDWTEISGANAAQLTLAQAQVGASIRAKVSYTDGAGTLETVYSAATSAVANVNNASTGSVGIALQSDTSSAAPAMVSASSTLVASNSLADIDGMGTVQYQWQQQSQDASGATVWVDIDQANTETLAVSNLAGKTVRVAATYTDAFGTLESRVSASTLVNDLPIGAVTLSGTFTQGQTLTASHTLQDTNGLGQVHYQWLADGAAINGASAATFTLTQAQVGKAISVQAGYTDLAGTSEAVSSATSALVANVNDGPTGRVALEGYTMVAQTLKATNTLADADGIATPMSYQWQVSSNGSSAWANIAGATADSLALTLAQQGKYVRAVADYTDAFGTHEVVYGTASAKIAHANFAPKFAKTTVNSKVFENSSFVSQAYAVNTDPGDTVTYTVTGTNSDLFQVVNGALQFKAAPNFESAASLAAKNSYVVDLVATDAFGLSAKQKVNITVLNVNEAPVWAEESRTVFVKDGSALVDNVRGTHLLDPDLTDNPVRYTRAVTIGGADAKLFTSTLPGKLSFTSAAVKARTLSADGDRSYQLELIATDNGGLSTDTQFLTVQSVNVLGTSGNDTLVGTAASDRMAGLGGNDRLTGGAGADTFYVSEGQDSITDLGNGADVLNVAAGAQVAAQVTASWTATAKTVNLGTATLTASASIDLSAVTSGYGFVLDAAAANLTLKGSQGADTFVLHADMVDTVLSFESGKDSISFKGLTGMAGGAVASNAFVAGAGLTAAATADQHLILNTTTGDLYFDADGSGGSAAVLLAHFNTGALPTLADLHVVAVL